MKKCIKKICLTAFAVLTIVCTTFVFAGCVSNKGSYVIKVAKTTTRNGEISAAYSYFNGTRTYYVKFRGGEEISFTFATEEGELEYKITDGSGNTIKSGEAGDNSFVLTFKEAGRYSFEFTASAHKGSYKLTW